MLKYWGRNFTDPTMWDRDENEKRMSAACRQGGITFWFFMRAPQHLLGGTPSCSTFIIWWMNDIKHGIPWSRYLSLWSTLNNFCPVPLTLHWTGSSRQTTDLIFETIMIWYHNDEEATAHVALLLTYSSQALDCKSFIMHLSTVWGKVNASLCKIIHFLLLISWWQWVKHSIQRSFVPGRSNSETRRDA